MVNDFPPENNIGPAQSLPKLWSLRLGDVLPQLKLPKRSHGPRAWRSTNAVFFRAVERPGIEGFLPWEMEIYPLVMTDIAIEHGPFIVDFLIKHSDFP